MELFYEQTDELSAVQSYIGRPVTLSEAKGEENKSVY